jgi:hypothetical protein
MQGYRWKKVESRVCSQNLIQALSARSNQFGYGGRGHKSCNWQGLGRPHATPHRSGRATELRGLVA